ncbi:GAF domain-containing protein [Myxococcota bacterium]|nr:GAF domain-containing protein [Myxococcota bacterium]MBU1534116.1 GAF domain-containing protein [Myxococcota bacterium]
MEPSTAKLHGDQLAALLEGSDDFLVNASQFCAFVWHVFPRINWAGFYLLRSTKLYLGPFQGKVACNPIEIGEGVCGTSFMRRRSVVVEEVESFEGHIACDPDSRSELVVPLLHKNDCLGVFDMDSPVPARFGAADQRLMEELVAVFMERTHFCPSLLKYPLR